MLVLTRKAGEKIVIDGGIVLEVIQSRGNRVRIGITAPPEVSVLRGEIVDTPLAVRRASDTGSSLLESASPATLSVHPVRRPASVVRSA